MAKQTTSSIIGSFRSITLTRVVRVFSPLTPLLFRGIFATAQDTPYPGQPLTGPGGAEYIHSSVAFFDAAAEADGYWLFEPANPKPDSAEVVVFLHGYGAYNPMAYGKWIKHLVAKGNIVIYPRYQKNLMWPRPEAFPQNAAIGIRRALAELQKEERVKPKTEKVAYIGHSYGGVIAANLGVNWQKYDIPKPASMLLCEPGSGPFKGARLSDYSALSDDLQMVVVVGEDDYVVGDEFGRLVFHSAINTPQRNLVIQRRSTDGRRWISASHSEPYCYDLDFDTGVRNYTSKRVLYTSRLNEVDFNCYWKFADALMESTRNGCYTELALGNTPDQRWLGCWPNGKPMRELEVLLPGGVESETAMPHSIPLDR
ncbi:MAG: alpha/beta hydrolase fold domain-containing protein [Saprospiraceae bacterium]|nr:alpha/beta hydrolase fold domain-containing protein [Saprospiraceae bacterium]